MAEAADYLFDDDVIEPEIYGRFADPHHAFRLLVVLVTAGHAPAHRRASFVHGLKHLPIRVRLRCG